MYSMGGQEREIPIFFLELTKGKSGPKCNFHEEQSNADCKRKLEISHASSSLLLSSHPSGQGMAWTLS